MDKVVIAEMNIEYFKTSEYATWLTLQPTLLQKAKELATNTFTGNEDFYLYFCDMVAFELQPFGVICQAAGMLHDIIHLVPSTSSAVNSLSPDLWAIVDVCTDKSRSSKLGDEVRSGNFYQRFKELEGPEIKVEVAYRMCTIRSIYEQGWKDELQAYQKEHRMFKKTLYHRGVCDGYWEIMERCFAKGLINAKP